MQILSLDLHEMRLFKLENIYYNIYLDEEGKKMSGDLFIPLNITGWSAGCLLCDSDFSASVRIGLVSSIAATLPPDQAESENWTQSRERCEFKSCPNKIPTSCGACFMFRKFGTFSITFATGSTNLMTTGKETD